MKLTADNLKTELWETLQGVKRKRIEPGHANAVCSAARQILSVVRTEIAFTNIIGQKPAPNTAAFLLGDKLSKEK